MEEMVNLKEHICEATPIGQLIGETISLRRQGRRLVGAHQTHGSDSGRSFHVDPEQGLYYCFNCGEGGDVFAWVMHLHQWTFSEALRYLAQRAHVTLPEWTDEERARQERLRNDEQALKPIYLAAADFYRSGLSPAIEAWCAEQWGFCPDTLQRFRIGFAPVEAQALWHHLLGQGFDRETLTKSGLFVQVKGDFVDFFQGRVVFPYWSAFPDEGRPGDVVYFIARQTAHTPDVEWECAKYRKLPRHSERHPYISETVSNRWFYGEHCLLAAKGKDLLITEGVPDAVAALQAGIACISPATTKFREADWPRLARLAKTAKQIIIINDAEENQSGERGALQTAAHLFKGGIDARIGTLPRPEGTAKVDLAEYLTTHCPEDLRRIMADARPIVEFSLDRVRQAPDRDKVKVAEETYPLIRRLSGVERNRAEKALQKALGGAGKVSSDAIRKAIAQSEPSRGHARAGAQVPYEANEDGIRWWRTTSNGVVPIQLTNFDAHVIANIVEDDGVEISQAFEIEASLNGRATRRMTITVERFAAMHWPSELLGAQALVYPGFGVRDHARAAIQLLSKDITERRVYKHTGWRRLPGHGWVYLHSGGALGADGPVADIAVALPDALMPLILPTPPTGAALVAAIQASRRIPNVASDAVSIPLWAAIWRVILERFALDHEVRSP
jgi:DNA primase catalytic core